MLFTDNVKFDLLGVFIALAVTLVLWHKWKLGYWKRKGVRGPEPLIFFGNTKDMLMGKKTLGQLYRDIYLEFKPQGNRHVGTFFFGSPNYLPFDLELVKRILQTDFKHFHSHGIYSNENSDPLSANVFNLDGPKWREIRAKLTPTFTSGKIKTMHQTILECANVFEEVLQECSESNPVEIKDLTVRFTTDVIGSCAFGLEINSLRNPNTEMRIYGNKILEPTLMTLLRNIPSFAFSHSFLKSINYAILPKDVSNFFYRTVESTVNHREQNKISRKDFLNLLIELKNSGKGVLSINEIAAQSFIFFLAGFETSSTTINFAVYELAVNSDIQEKLREDINTVLKKYNGEVTYDAVMEMEYLDQVVHETLRKYPPLQILFRKCTQDYVIEEENLLIEEGYLVIIPVLGIHYDPEYYPHPHKFDPERFNEENKKKIPQFAYLPFGEGPRICIGLRFGLMETKIGLITLLRNFKFSLNKKTKTPLVFSKTGLITTSQDGIWLDLQKISKTL